MLRIFSILTAILLVTACAPGTQKQQEALNAEHYLKKGESYFERELYDEAIESWEKVRDSYYSPELNILAELKIAEAYFLAERYVEATAAYEDFLKQHPEHPRTADVLYRLGQAYFKQILSIDRDQTATRNALATFEIFREKFPQDPRDEEAGALVRRAKDHLASHELYVGRFYFRTDEYQAAIMRLEDLFAKYPNFYERDESYFYLGRAYLATGQREEAVETFNTLMREFPNSEYILKAQKIIAKNY